MVQDLTDDAGLVDEGNDAHFPPAVFANQRIGFEHTTDKIGRSFPQGFPLGGVGVVGGGGWSASRIFSSSSGVVPVVQDRVLVRLGDVDEHAGEELERVEELGFSRFGCRLIEDEFAFGVVVKSLKRDGASNDVSAEGFESLAIGGIEVEIIIDAKAASAPGTKEVHALVGEEALIVEESKNFFSKEKFRAVGVDVGNGDPMSPLDPDSSGDDAMQVWMPLQIVGESLNGDDHAWPRLLVNDGGGHELLNGFESSPGKLGE
jgi:hypothetical protein